MPTPLAWYSQISPEPSERVPVKCLRAAMYWPSGDQVGVYSMRKSSFVTALASLPSAFITHTLSPPPASLM